MRAIEITQPGGPDVLQIGTRPMPQARAGEVLVKVAAAGVNRPDILQRKGQYPPPKGASDIPGLEVAGTVVALGEGVREPALGAEVCALVSGGGYADYCVVPAPQCLPIPRGLSRVEGASLPETFFTVWSNVVERGRLAKGETFLVQGGSSGIGVTAIQMAAALGARVFATAGSVDKCAACERLGAERCVNYKTEDFVEVLKQATDGKGVDVILDMVGGDYIPREVTLLAEEGRLVIIATLGGSEARVNLRDIMTKRLTVTGSTLRTRPVAFKGAIARALQANIWPLIEAVKIRPVVYRTFPLAAASEAHRLMESGEHIGKIVLTTEREGSTTPV
jgi:NADPH2:quinone reductase